MRKEKSFERSASRKALERYGVPNIKLFHAGGETGWPDRCYFIPGGKPLYIEFKWPGEVPGPRQVYIHNMLRGLGYEVCWCDNEESALAAIAAAVEAARLPEEGAKAPRGKRGRRTLP